MKKLTLALSLLVIAGLLSSTITAQESTSGSREIYLSGNMLSFTNLGLQYKSELKSGNFFRIGVNNFHTGLNKWNYAPNSLYNTLVTNISLGFEAGLEKRIKITDKLTAFYGVNFLTSFSFERNKRENPALTREQRFHDDFSIEPGFGFNSGFILNITGNFSIAAEIIPALIYSHSSFERIDGNEKVKDINNSFNFNLDNQSARVSLIYRWNK
jgi:hypothetical protein